MTPTVEPPARDRVDVWEFRLDVSDAARTVLAGRLSADERERAGRMREGWIRDRFVAGRGRLRELLAPYLAVAPEAIEFRTLAHGKPVLAGPPGLPAVTFNLAHSADLALLAVTLERTLGIDVEQVRPDRAHDDLARRFFSPGEREALAALDPEARMRAFYTCWTRKEAYLKAHGAGISYGLGCFEVMRPGEARAALFANSAEPADVGRWRLFDLEAPAGFAAALAIEGDARIVRRSAITPARPPGA